MSPAFVASVAAAHAGVLAKTGCTLRHDWLGDLLERTEGQNFDELLRQLSPGTYRALPEKSTRACYVALIQYLGHRCFPVWETTLDWLDDEDAQGDIFAHISHEGIPFAPEGFDLEEESTSPALALAWTMYETTSLNFAAVTHTCLAPFRDRLAGWLPQHILPPESAGQNPPRRRWVRPWDAAGDLYRYTQGALNNPFLDYCALSQQANMAFPPWNVDEVRALSRLWQEAKPVLRRIGALAAYVDALPAERLPVLSGVLRMDPETVQSHSRPVRVKTLAEVFSRRLGVRA